MSSKNLVIILVFACVLAFGCNVLRHSLQFSVSVLALCVAFETTLYKDRDNEI